MFITYPNEFLDYRHTWNTEDIMSKPEEIWELSTLAHPPMNRIACLKIFWQKFEVLVQLVHHCFAFQ